MKFSFPLLLTMLALPAVVVGKKKKGGKGGKGKGEHAPGDEDCACRGQVSYGVVQAPPRVPCIMTPNQFMMTPYDNKDREYLNNAERRLDHYESLTAEAWQEYLNASPEFESCVLAPVTSKDDLEYYDYLKDNQGPAVLGVFKDIREAQDCRASTEPGDRKVDDDCFDDWKNMDSSAGSVPCDEDLWEQRGFDMNGERDPQPDGVSYYGDLATVGVLSGNGPVMFDEEADETWSQAIVKCCNNRFSKCLNEPSQDEMVEMMPYYMMMMMMNGRGGRGGRSGRRGDRDGGERDGDGRDRRDDDRRRRDCEEAMRSGYLRDNSGERRKLDDCDDYWPRQPTMVQVLRNDGLSWEWLFEEDMDDLPMCGESGRKEKRQFRSGELAVATLRLDEDP